MGDHIIDRKQLDQLDSMIDLRSDLPIDPMQRATFGRGIQERLIIPTWVFEEDNPSGLKIVNLSKIEAKIREILKSHRQSVADEVRAAHKKDLHLPLSILYGTRWSRDDDRLWYARYAFQYSLLTENSDVLFYALRNYEVWYKRGDIAVHSPPTREEQKKLQPFYRQLAEFALKNAKREKEEYEAYLKEVEYIKGVRLNELRMRVATVDLRGYPLFASPKGLEPVAEAWIAIAPYVSAVVDFVPIAGQIKGVIEAVSGHDLFTMEKLPDWQRGVGAILALIPFARGIFKGGVSGAGKLAILAVRTIEENPKITAGEIYRMAKVASHASEEELQVAKAIKADKVLSIAEKRAVKTVSGYVDEYGKTIQKKIDDATNQISLIDADANRLSRTASGVIDNGRSLERTASGTLLPKAVQASKVVTNTLSKAAQSLIAKGFLPEAVQSLENLGIKVTQKLAKQLENMGDTGRNFLNLFYQSKGFHRVVADFAKGGNKTIGAEFVMHFASTHREIIDKVKANPLLVAFEWGAGIKKSSRFGDIFAREIDIVVRGEATLGMEETIYNELKNWTKKSLDRAAKNGKLAKQVVRDTAILGPQEIRWVFNRQKIASESEIIDVFTKIIEKDMYLKNAWGSDSGAIRSALERVIQVWP